ncbi:MAG: hypothetical protein ACW987_16865, partial [Candidatus Thorarchaeota archaeon]
MNFKEWLHNEVFGSSFRYTFPENKKHQIYDFYMLNQIANTNSLNRVRASSGMRGLNWQKGGERFQSREDEIDYAIEEVKKNLVNGLHRQLLIEVSQSIMGELRHWFEYTDFANFLMHGSTKGPHGDPKDNQSDCEVGVSKDGSTFTRIRD